MDKKQPNWHEFHGPSHELPPERKLVMVIVKEEPEKGLPPTLAVGYLRYAAGDKQSPYFVVPGRGGHVSHWLDCIAEDFATPKIETHHRETWQMIQGWHLPRKVDPTSTRGANHG